MSSFDGAVRGLGGLGARDSALSGYAVPTYRAEVEMYENTQGPHTWQSNEKGKSWTEGRSAAAFFAPYWANAPHNRKGWILYFRWQGSPTGGTKAVSQGGYKRVSRLAMAQSMMHDWVAKGELPSR